MKFSYQWLKELSGTKLSPQKLAELLTLHSFEAVLPEKVGNDYLIDLDILPNRRPDALSHLGVAREIAVLAKGKPRLPKATPLEWLSKLPIQTLRLSAAKDSLVPRYTAVLLENVRNRPSPAWMQERLRFLGLRPINAVVDITNYVMVEIGSPLHAFDYDKIGGQRMHIREAKQGEKLITLDGVTRTLPAGAIIIEDAERIIDLAGIMGGENTAVEAKTMRVILQGAMFDRAHIYRTSKAMAHRTEAALRYANGFDSSIALWGFSRAVNLFQEICGARPLGIIDRYSKKEARPVIFLPLAKIPGLLGKEVSEKTSVDLLKRLGCEVSARALRKPFGKAQGKEQGLFVRPPAWRNDLLIPEDLIEEIGRIIGWDRITVRTPELPVRSVEPNESALLERKVRSILVGAGLSEVYNYSFVSARELEAISCPLSAVSEVENPTSEDFRYLRPILLVGLVKNIRDNLRFFDTVRIFEIGKVFSAGKKGVGESPRLGGIVAIKGRPPSGGEPFFEAKGIVDTLLEELGIPERWYDDASATSEVAPQAMWHPSRAAEIKVDSEEIGFLGEIDPQVLKAFDISEPVAAFELDFKKLLKLSREEREFKPIPKYPAVMRDISFLVNAEVRVAQAEDLIWNSASKILRDVELVDVYESFDTGLRLSSAERPQGMGRIPEGKISMTFRLVFQSEERTLTDEEVNKEMMKIQKTLDRELRAEIR